MCIHSCFNIYCLSCAFRRSEMHMTGMVPAVFLSMRLLLLLMRKWRMMPMMKIQQQTAEDDADRRIISSSVVSRQVPVTRPRATPHADTTSIPAVQTSQIHVLQRLYIAQHSTHSTMTMVVCGAAEAGWPFWWPGCCKKTIFQTCAFPTHSRMLGR